MQPTAALQKRFEAERLRRPFQVLPQIGDDGLTFGRITALARCAKSSSGQDLSDADQTRILALLGAVYGQPVVPQTSVKKTSNMGLVAEMFPGLRSGQSRPDLLLLGRLSKIH